jgi:hypothetical protein
MPRKGSAPWNKGMRTIKINKCKANDCRGKVISTKGYCRKHYLQMHRLGRLLNESRLDFNEIIEHGNYLELVLRNAKREITGKAKLDKDDLTKVKRCRFFLNKQGYAYNTRKGFLHRMILGLDKTDKKITDHINRDRLDNRKSNLRVSSHFLNSHNRKLSRVNTSGVTGVLFHKQTQKWYATLCYKYTPIYSPLFQTKKEAVEYRKILEKKYLGD